MSSWLAPDELRIGLGCMRLEQEAEATIAAAVESGITIFDTARAYEGSEARLAGALRDVPGARVVTKGGMAPPFRASLIPDAQVLAGPSTPYFLNHACICFQASSAASLR